jgi:hypothetical protein
MFSKTLIGVMSIDKLLFKEHKSALLGKEIHVYNTIQSNKTLIQNQNVYYTNHHKNRLDYKQIYSNIEINSVIKEYK